MYSAYCQKGNPANFCFKEVGKIGKHNVSYQAECPFYRSEDKRIIYCEGPVEGAATQVAFPGSAETYKKTYCYSAWQKCLIARALAGKYE